MIHKKIRFQGEIYWYHKEDKSNHVNISPLDHYDDMGDLTANPFRDVSFAIVEGDKIMQYGEQIGTIVDLEDINEESQDPQN